MNTRNDIKWVSVSLLALLALFVFRVMAQLVQAVYPVSFLPPFAAWQSGALPYPILLLIQLAIVGYFGRIIWKLHRGMLQPDPVKARVFILIGGLYFAVMLFRLVAGFSFAADHPWLGARIPAVFHLILASFLLIVGFFHSSATARMVAVLAYPLVVLSALVAHALCLRNGVGLHAATYGPVLFGALAVTLLERGFPHRGDWLPNRADVANDAAYMVLVQALLPRFLGFLAAVSLLGILRAQQLTLDGPWPQHWPVIAQALLMMVTAEFMRYWVHRLAHRWTPLWQLHAVHHSPHKLYWMNVGRFHPLEKALQYLFDTLPFILLGVSEQVLAMYFVFYAINGFFQHCNIDLRLGFLNYIISGPELHRWHHSKLIEESNHNYGNNLIIWDLMFGTWFLPRDRQVGDLGLVNREYPLSFSGQMKTPFITGLDKA